MRSTFIYTTGAPGSGKSYYRCARYLLDDYLKNTTTRHISNFPIEFDSWTDAHGVEQPGLVALAKKRCKIDEETLRDRVITFPAEAVDAWRNVDVGKKGHHIAGPWDLLDGVDISGAHIALDEIHNFCGAKKAKSIQDRWEQWIGEIRHQGATVEFLTQHPKKVAACIPQHCEMRHQLVKGETRPDFWFKILMYDWYQLRAKLTGRWFSTFWQITQRNELDKWKTTEERKFWLDPEYFGVYNSHSQPVAGGTAGAERPMEWQTKNWLQLLLWFADQNGYRLATKGALLALIPTLLFASPWIAPFYFEAIPKYLAGRTTVSEMILGDDKKTAVPTEPVKRALRSEIAPGEKLTPRKPAASLAADLHATDTPLNFTLGLLTQDTAVFRCGFAYKLGETIDAGPYKGRSLKAIDFGRRLVQLDNGRVLRLGADVGLPDTAPAAPGPDVHQSVPGAQIADRPAAAANRR